MAWWPGEGDARDIIGTNNGALMGGVTFVTGEVGMAFSFDGSSGYIAVSNTSSMDFGTNDFTIAGWIRLSTLDAGPGGGREIIHKSVGSVPGNNNYTYFLEDDPAPRRCVSGFLIPLQPMTLPSLLRSTSALGITLQPYGQATPIRFI